MSLFLLVPLAVALAPLTPGAAAPRSRTIEVSSSTAVEVLPQPPPLALEEGMFGDMARYYAAGISALRAGQYRRAVTEVRQARVLAYRSLTQGSKDLVSRRLARRHFTRILYLEEQLSELVLVEEQLEHPPERLDQRSALLQIRALLMHNMFLAVRGFLGVDDARLLKESLRAYQVALEQADNLKHSLLVGYAAMLAERGSRREARLAFAKLSESERDQESMDIAVAYYYLALGDRGRAISRLLLAAGRDSWLHGSPGREGQAFRSQVYHMNDFDRLRDHPRFIALVTTLEER